MTGETNLTKLIQNMSPKLNDGEYVFITAKKIDNIDFSVAICHFKEAEGITFIIPKKHADEMGYKYDFVAAWITLKVHSALEAVGLTATFATALAQHHISANVIAGYYHDHIFVDVGVAKKAVHVLNGLAKSRQ